MLGQTSTAQSWVPNLAPGADPAWLHAYRKVMQHVWRSVGGQPFGQSATASRTAFDGALATERRTMSGTPAQVTHRPPGVPDPCHVNDLVAVEPHDVDVDVVGVWALADEWHRTAIAVCVPWNTAYALALRRSVSTAKDSACSAGQVVAGVIHDSGPSPKRLGTAQPRNRGCEPLRAVW
jgi:hypothetical protein